MKAHDKQLELALVKLVIAVEDYERAIKHILTPLSSKCELNQAEDDLNQVGEVLDNAMDAAKALLGMKDTGRRIGECRCCNKQTVFLYQGTQAGIEGISAFTLWGCSVCGNVVSGHTLGLDPAEETRLLADALVAS